MTASKYRLLLMKRVLIVVVVFTLCSMLSYAQPGQKSRLGPATIAVPMASLYKDLSDTTQNIIYLTKGNSVEILNTDDYYWVLVSRGNRQFYISRPSLGITYAPSPPVSWEMLKSVARDPDGEINYTAVVSVEGKSQNDLYLRGKVWVINVFRSPKNVLTTEEKDVGIIICKGFTEEVLSFSGRSSLVKLYFTVKMSTKEGKYKYEIRDFYFQLYSTAQNPSPEKISARVYIDSAFGHNGKPDYISQQYSMSLINKAALLEANVRKALSKGEDW